MKRRNGQADRNASDERGWIRCRPDIHWHRFLGRNANGKWRVTRHRHLRLINAPAAAPASSSNGKREQEWTESQNIQQCLCGTPCIYRERDARGSGVRAVVPPQSLSILFCSFALTRSFSSLPISLSLSLSVNYNATLVLYCSVYGMRQSGASPVLLPASARHDTKKYFLEKQILSLEARPFFLIFWWRIFF